MGPGLVGLYLRSVALGGLPLSPGWRGRREVDAGKGAGGQDGCLGRLIRLSRTRSVGRCEDIECAETRNVVNTVTRR